MPRYAPKISKADFLATVKSYGVAREWDQEWETEDNNSAADTFIPNGLIEGLFTDALKDLEKIDFNWENCEVEQYIELKSGVTVALVYAGGDWESPLYFAFYYDGKKFRAYMPSDSNVYNRTTKQAYGNAEEDEDNADALKHYGVNDYYSLEADMTKVIAEIENRIVARGAIGAVDFENTAEAKARKESREAAAAKRKHLLETEPDLKSMESIDPSLLRAVVMPAAGGAYFNLKLRHSNRELTVAEGRKVAGLNANFELHEISTGTPTWYPPPGLSSKHTAALLEKLGFEIDREESYLADYRQHIIYI